MFTSDIRPSQGLLQKRNAYWIGTWVEAGITLRAGLDGENVSIGRG